MNIHERLFRMQRIKTIIVHFLAIIFIVLYYQTIVNAQTSIRFAAIGDYGWEGQADQDVANLVKSWNPDFIITLGDNNYDWGADSSIDRNIGQYYHEFIYPYTGTYGLGDTVNRFFPCLGNHDWYTIGALPYLNYFTLPENERYYDFVKGPIHFFVLDSDPHEPDGDSLNSIQGRWFQAKLATATEKWKIVYFHHPPYNSGVTPDPNPRMNWPFKQLGVNAVLSGHEHVYERLTENGLVYFINGLGGKDRMSFGVIDTGSQTRFNKDFGAMLIEANQDSLYFRFYTRKDSLVDSFIIKSSSNDIRGSGMMIPYEFYLGRNYPNPFNPLTKIEYKLPVESHVHLKIYNVFGQEIDTLVDNQQPAGYYGVQFISDRIASGTYFYTLSTATFRETQKMVVLK